MALHPSFPPTESKPATLTHAQVMDDLNHAVLRQGQKLSQLHDSLLAAIANERRTRTAFNETGEHKEYAHQVNYLIDRCRAAKYELAQRENERSDYLIKTLGLTPDIDLPLSD